MAGQGDPAGHEHLSYDEEPSPLGQAGPVHPLREAPGAGGILEQGHSELAALGLPLIDPLPPCLQLARILLSAMYRVAEGLVDSLYMRPLLKTDM